MQVELRATCIDTSISILFLLSPSKVGKNNNIIIILFLSLGKFWISILFLFFLKSSSILPHTYNQSAFFNLFF